MSKVKNIADVAQESNKFNLNDNDIERDMKTLGQIRDDLFLAFKTSTDINAKVSIAAAIQSTCHSRQNSEVLMLRLGGYFDHEGDEDYVCPDCQAELAGHNHGTPESN